MSTDYLIPSQPDILEVISNLSNDEVFTPPRVVNAVLDMLPESVWSDPTLRWLDPGCKTGVFPREITKRLMRGLADAIPDEADRLDHILRTMVFAIAITEITSMMARRTLYCSKNASGEHSAVALPSSDGHVWFERIEHPYVNGRCSECGGSEAQLEREGRDNYAYAFIHDAGRALLKKEIDMKFDVIVGNPPYQMDAESGNRTMPIYNLFVDTAKSLNPRYIAFIMPSRWMAGGLGLGEFRAEMLTDKRTRKLVDFPNASEVFPGVEIKGGVCYLLWDRDQPGPCDMTIVRGGEAHGPVPRDLGQFDVLVRDSRGLEILEKVLKVGEDSIIEMLSADKEFGMTSNFSGYSMKKTAGTVPIYANRGGQRVVGYMKRSAVEKSTHLIDTWKVLVPKAGSDGGQKLPDVVLGSTQVAPSPSVCTQTYLFFFVASESEAMSIQTYVRTRFFRFLVSLRKSTQDATRSTYTWVPQQSWTKTWTDEELFKKYKITKREQAYIAEMVKEMPA